VSDIIVPSGPRERLESFVGRRLQTWAIAAVVGIVVVVALLLWRRSAPAAVVAPPAEAPAAEGPAAVAPAPVESSPSGPIFVHVAGAVRRPGLYELAPGARVADAIDAANGPLRRADVDALNLAEVLTDGVQVYVARRGETPPAESSPTASVAGGASPAAPSVVDVNTADQASLEAIPGIGPVKAAAILQHRDQIGSFDSVEQLLDVTGIGPATLEAIRPYVSV
jgi:competence protein ComEA